MPLLDGGGLPVAPIEVYVEVVRNQLANAQDTNGKPLNQSVTLGIDTVMADAIKGQPNYDAVPCIRILFPVESYYTDASTGSMMWQIVPLQLYFLYTFPKGNTLLPDSFTTLRDRHIRWNLEYLKEQRVKPNNSIGLTFDINWKWVSGQVVTIDHDTPFRYLDETVRVRPSSGFTCSRVDMSMQVRNHI